MFLSALENNRLIESTFEAQKCANSIKEILEKQPRLPKASKTLIKIYVENIINIHLLPSGKQSK